MVHRMFVRSPIQEEKNVLLIEDGLGETRVAHFNNGVLENFQTELWHMQPEKGNIYRAKVERIETSLQAIFVDYGNEKQGFLPFSEIHPGYLAHIPGYANRHQKGDESYSADQSSTKKDDLKGLDLSPLKDTYMLVQITKDARSSKGAALTTFLAIKGRYVIFMPNTPDTLGVSKKIQNDEDRSDIKAILQSFSVPEGMGAIARSSCLGKKRADIKRDYDYVMRLWDKIKKDDSDNIALLYEEQGLLVRALRDMYQPDMESVVINAAHAYKKARQFMRSFMPKSLKKVRFLDVPALLAAFDLQDQIANIDQNVVSLASGGSIVIDPTEALVAIDVNSSKSRQHRNIEETAFQTNMEAAKEIARQLRLRDLSGLIVIDFIDVPVAKRSHIEKALQAELDKDSAVTRMGAISAFGLMEMSRQRLRQSFLERRTQPCRTCGGTGRSMLSEVAGSQILRTLAELMPHVGSAPKVVICASERLILYILNHHRAFIRTMEKKYNIIIQCDIENNKDDAYCRIDIPSSSWSMMVLGQKESDAISVEHKVETKSQSSMLISKDRKQKKHTVKDDSENNTLSNKESKEKDTKARSSALKGVHKKGAEKKRGSQSEQGAHVMTEQDSIKKRKTETACVDHKEKDRHLSDVPDRAKGKNDAGDQKKTHHSTAGQKGKEKSHASKKAHVFSIVLPPPKKKTQ